MIPFHLYTDMCLFNSADMYYKRNNVIQVGREMYEERLHREAWTLLDVEECKGLKSFLGALFMLGCFRVGCHHEQHSNYPDQEVHGQ